jgi:hypothetical protein
MLRSHRSCPMRRIGLPSVRRRKSSSVHANSSASVLAREPFARCRSRAACSSWRTCSRGRSAGSRRSRRCGWPSAGAAPAESARVLDGEVRDAAPRIEPARRDDGLRGAHVDAGAAAAAVRAQRARSAAAPCRRRSRPGRTSSPRRGRAPACACRASPGRCASRQLGLEHRGRVGEGAVAEGADLFGDALGQFLPGGCAAPCGSPAPARRRTRWPRRGARGARTRWPATRGRCRAAGNPCAR